VAYEDCSHNNPLNLYFGGQPCPGGVDGGPDKGKGYQTSPSIGFRMASGLNAVSEFLDFFQMGIGGGHGNLFASLPFSKSISR